VEAIRVSREVRPDIVLMDIGLGGLQRGRGCRGTPPPTCGPPQVVILSMYDDEPFRRLAIRSASGHSLFLRRPLARNYWRPCERWPKAGRI